MAQTQKTVWNVTRDTALVQALEMATNPWTRLKGLMGRPGLPEGHGLWIEPCADIHSCFMRFQFDALFLDKQGRVLYCIEGMQPWRFSKWVKGSRTVLELPAGVIAQSQTQVGDEIVIR